MHETELAIELARTEGKVTDEAVAHLRLWLGDERFGQFTPAIEAAVKRADWNELEDAFYARVKVGTGGIRGPVGVGPNRINLRTIGEAAQALSNFIADYGEDAVSCGVVIGHEVRRQSRQFAEACAMVFAANGIKSYLFDGIRATPELSFAVRFLNATAGVQITASHNPRTDNGFKFYWSDGGQVVPPLDQKFMDMVGAVEQIKTMDIPAAEASGLVISVGEQVDAAYLAAVRAQSLTKLRSANIVFSPMHGAGSTNVLPVLESEGFKVDVVPEQLQPDENFPTAFGNLINPEFPEVMTMPKQLAEAQRADLALMSDPDADRIGVGAKASLAGNEIRLLSGNQVGVALVKYILTNLKAQGSLRPDNIVIETSVTTSLIADIARSYGIHVTADLLVGFKYVGEIINHLADASQFVFAAEESLGYLRGTYARDKDAALSALLIAEMASWLKDQDKTIVEYLDEIYAEYGYYCNRLKPVEPGQGRAGKDRITAMMKGLRANLPVKLAGRNVIRVEDRLPEELRQPSKYITGATGDQLTFVLSEDGPCKVTARPSGTEPVIKFYTQVFARIDTTDLTELKAETDDTALKLEQAIVSYAESVSESSLQS